MSGARGGSYGAGGYGGSSGYGGYGHGAITMVSHQKLHVSIFVKYFIVLGSSLNLIKSARVQLKLENLHILQDPVSILSILSLGKHFIRFNLK